MKKLLALCELSVCICIASCTSDYPGFPQLEELSTSHTYTDEPITETYANDTLVNETASVEVFP
ncbi:MAG: hypothetical protein Q4D56_04510 [Bacteroides sp.]|nr:hypothetical protein [Bacteroides sp.]